MSTLTALPATLAPPLELDPAEAEVELLDVAELVGEALLELLEFDEPQPARRATTPASAKREARFMGSRLLGPALPPLLNWSAGMSGHSKWHSIKHKKA